MVSPCSICLSPFKDPVCLPCGHLYCKKCLTEHVNSPNSRGMTSTCPDCRSSFNIAIPDLTYLPEKYHPFISHAVRRVYIDMDADAGLQRKLKQAEARLASKAKSEEALLKKCESLSAAVSAHRTGEAEALNKVDELEEKIEDLEDDYKEKVEQCREQRTLNLELLKKNKEQKAQILALQKSLAAAKIDGRETPKVSKTKVPKPRQRSVERESDDSGSSFISSPIRRPVASEEEDTPPKGRCIKPLPRRRIIRARDDDSVTMTLAPPKRARMFST